MELRRFRYYFIAVVFLFSAALLFAGQPYLPRHFRPAPKVHQHHQDSPLDHQETVAPPPAGPCVGARGTSLQDPLSQDIPHAISHLPNTTYPQPTFGSYDAIGLPKTWMTFEQRYGPYGYQEESDSYNFSRVDWNKVDWGQLQDQCLMNRPNRFYGSEFAQTTAPPRFRLLQDENVQKSQGGSTGRQAIVIRVWSTYDYTPEDLWNVRSIITEASLATHGNYTVFLLVDVKREDGAKIHEDDEFYREVLKEAVPEEFQNMAVLFHRSLQKSWYKKVDEIRPVWQIMQPLQLFAHFYPEFDHFWQFEMDNRFTGDVGQMLNAFHDFGTASPIKQARERASWTYMPRVHGNWKEFSKKIDDALDGNATVWGPVKVDAIEPIGPKPPVDDPRDDNFEWGVGQEAELLLLTPMFDVLRFSTIDDWVFKDWVGGGIQKTTPRFQAAPAQARASRTLLEAIHTGQHEHGIYLASEATLPSFALWHGLKTISAPMPKFQWPERELRELNMIYNGGPIRNFEDGIANGIGPYKKHLIEWYARPMTFQWSSSLPNPTFDHWMGQANSGNNRLLNRAAATDGAIPDELPGFLAEVDGLIYAPGFLMHPRKTNKPPPPMKQPP